MNWILLYLTEFHSDKGQAVGQSFALPLERLRFPFRWGHWDFSLTLSYRPHSEMVVDSARNKNEYQRGKGGRGVGLTTLPHSCADFLENSNFWNPHLLYRYFLNSTCLSIGLPHTHICVFQKLYSFLLLKNILYEFMISPIHTSIILIIHGLKICSSRNACGPRLTE
jgi:hypothetical protein